jgi:hypothetical protein
MKILADSGERVLIIVPARLGTSAAIAIETERGAKVVDVVVEDGLIGNMVGHVANRRDVPKIKEDKLRLWAHIVSMHAAIVSPGASLKELLDYHDNEHNGPGTIRNHPTDQRGYSIHEIGKVLSEAEPDDDPYEGSFRAAADNEGARIAASHDGED